MFKSLIAKAASSIASTANSIAAKTTESSVEVVTPEAEVSTPSTQISNKIGSGIQFMGALAGKVARTTVDVANGAASNLSEGFKKNYSK